MLKGKDLRNMSVEELQKKLQETRQEHFNLRFKHATAQLEKVSDLPALKRDIARILTILQEKGA